MKSFFCISLFLIGIGNLITAQNPSIINDINSSKTGQGEVVIYQDEAIAGLLGAKSNSSGSHEHSSGENGYVKARGYRIQVFSGNDQRRSKSEAEYRKRQISGSFPDMDVHISFQSPVWRVRAGNFVSMEEASQALKELKNAFPSFGREMQIVQDAIKLPVE